MGRIPLLFFLCFFQFKDTFASELLFDKRKITLAHTQSFLGFKIQEFKSDSRFDRNIVAVCQNQILQVLDFNSSFSDGFVGFFLELHPSLRRKRVGTKIFSEMITHFRCQSNRSTLKGVRSQWTFGSNLKSFSEKIGCYTNKDFLNLMNYPSFVFFIKTAVFSCWTGKRAKEFGFDDYSLDFIEFDEDGLVVDVRIRFFLSKKMLRATFSD